MLLQIRREDFLFFFFIKSCPQNIVYMDKWKKRIRTFYLPLYIWELRKGEKQLKKLRDKYWIRHFLFLFWLIDRRTFISSLSYDFQLCVPIWLNPLEYAVLKKKEDRALRGRILNVDLCSFCSIFILFLQFFLTKPSKSILVRSCGWRRSPTIWTFPGRVVASFVAG